jgi:hypothetical protein
MDRAQYSLVGFDEAPPRQTAAHETRFAHGRAELLLGDCIDWLERREPQSVHAVVTDPPYGLVEYSDAEQEKLRSRRGGVWRIPPSFDGAKRAPLPRFTVLNAQDHAALERFFYAWARSLLRALVPGANVLVASNPLLLFIVSGALARAGLERRGEIVRLVMTMRGGDRPKAAHVEFEQVSVMPRSMWEPWLVFRKPIEGRVQDNLRKWGTGGFRRISADKPFGDVIESAPTRAAVGPGCCARPVRGLGFDSGRSAGGGLFEHWHRARPRLLRCGHRRDRPLGGAAAGALKSATRDRSSSPGVWRCPARRAWRYAFPTRLVRCAGSRRR